MSSVKLAPKDYDKDAEFATSLHGKAERGGLGGLVSKNKDAHTEALNGYFKHWERDSQTQTDTDTKGRLDDYADLTKHYYNLVTDFYEYGWGSSFHFSRYYKGEAFKQATARHEHYLAAHMGLKPGMKVLDVGCGIGGPAREIARFADVQIVGINNNDYQITRGNDWAKRNGLADKIKLTKGDFMQMDFPDNSFDAVYSIEATVHAPVLEGVYSEIYRVLKPGGVFGVYEWVLTEKFDETNAKHREIAYGIEIGDGIPKMYSVNVARAALKKVGFEILEEDDLAHKGDAVPWWYPLSGDWRFVQTFGDLFTFCRTSRLGRVATTQITGALEWVGIAPKGSKQVTNALEQAAVYLVEGAKEEIFTPMQMFICKKPAKN